MMIGYHEVAYRDCVTVSKKGLRKTCCDVLKALSGRSIEDDWTRLGVES